MKEDPLLPNFFVLGAAKSGTTSLYHYLRQHPDIYLPAIKETNFFALGGKRADFKGPGDDRLTNYFSISKLNAYRWLYRPGAGKAARGEVCPLYLYSPRAPERIARRVPAAKLIAVLRDPAERAYSTYTRLRLLGREPEESFAAALADEPRRIRQNWEFIWHYRQAGFYHRQLARYYERFDRTQIKVFLYEEFDADPRAVLKEMLRFIGTDDSFTPDTGRRYNAGRSAADGNVRREPLPSDLRRELTASYREDVLALQSLLGRDLSAWLS